MYIDSHSHLFDVRNLSNSDLKDIDAVIVLSYSKATISSALDFCKSNSKYYCALGIYPGFANEYTDEIEDFIISNRANICAIGEIGLDESYEIPYDKQLEALHRQLDLAEKLSLPVSVHLRTKRDFETFFNILTNYKNIKGALHCFNGDLIDCQRALELGFYISFACNITYKGRVKLREIAKIVPDDKLLIETDSPSMLPASFARKGENVPANIYFVAETIANIRGCSIDKIAKITRDNAIKLFNLKV